jgi:hypothetical protein
MSDFKYAVEDSGVGLSSVILSHSFVFNAPPNTEMLRVSPNGFYVRGIKLEQDETEARQLFDALMNFMSGRGLNKTQIRSDAIEECAVLKKDAARYRWLRSYNAFAVTEKDGEGGYTLMGDEYLDAAIDDAMEKEVK